MHKEEGVDYPTKIVNYHKHRINASDDWIVYPEIESKNKRLVALNVHNPNVKKIFHVAFDDKIVNISYMKDNTFMLTSYGGQHCVLDVGSGHFDGDSKLSIQEILHVFSVQDPSKYGCLVNWGLEKNATDLILNIDSNTGNGITHLCAFADFCTLSKE